MEIVGIKDTFGESGSPQELMEAYGLTPDAIYKAAKRAIERKSAVGSVEKETVRL